MAFGAGTIAARKYGAAELVDPRPWAKGAIVETFAKYPNTGPVLPAMGYGEHQVRDLEATINAVDCDVVLAATPVELSRLVKIVKPVVRITYDYADHGSPTLKEVLLRKLNGLERL
jgi:predicted GTPase